MFSYAALASWAYGSMSKDQANFEVTIAFYLYWSTRSHSSAKRTDCCGASEPQSIPTLCALRSSPICHSRYSFHKQLRSVPCRSVRAIVPNNRRCLYKLRCALPSPSWNACTLGGTRPWLTNRPSNYCQPSKFKNLLVECLCAHPTFRS